MTKATHGRNRASVIVEREVVDVLGERQLGDGDLVFALEEADEITSGDIN